MSSKTGFSTVDTYNFILAYAIAHKGNTPSQRQVAKGCGFSGATAHACKLALIKEGLLEIIDGTLCIARADFVLHPDARNFGSTQTTTPDIRQMGIIPKRLQGTNKKKLAKLGVKVGKPVDEFYNEATYPSGWFYEKIDTLIVGQESYLLADEQGIYQAVCYRRQSEHGTEVILSTLEPD